MKYSPQRPLVRRLCAAAAGVMFLSASTASFAQAVPPAATPKEDAPTQNDRPPRPAARPVEGVVQGFNYGPEGDIESFMLAAGDGPAAQVNFPPHMSDAIAKAATVGATVKLTVEPDRGQADHPLLRLVSMIGADGVEMKLAGDDKDGHVEGTIQRLNYDRQGRVNGVVLERETFVQINPEAAAGLKLAVGQKVTVEGKQHATKSGQSVVRADSVNGSEIPHPGPKRPPHPPGGPGGPDSDRPAPPPADDGKGPPPPPDGGPAK